MRHRRHCHRRRLDFISRGNQLLNRAQGTCSVFLGNSVSTAGVSVHDRSQTPRFALPLELLVNTDVITSECAYANDGDVDTVVRVQGSDASWLVAVCEPDCRMFRLVFGRIVNEYRETRYRAVDKLRLAFARRQALGELPPSEPCTSALAGMRAPQERR